MPYTQQMWQGSRMSILEMAVLAVISVAVIVVVVLISEALVDWVEED